VRALALIGALLALALFGAGKAQAHFPNYCGHGYISNGSERDVFVRQYDEGLKHYHVYTTQKKVYDSQGDPVWVRVHQHTRVC